jgi:hypothetical protein
MVPALEMVADADPERVRRVSEAMFTMRKLDLNILREAYGRS